MKIKICTENSAAIECELLVANGISTAHTITSAARVVKLAAIAEQKLEDMDRAKKSRRGARLVRISGEPVANSYKYSRTATRVEIVRGSSDWFLISVRAQTIYQSGGSLELILT